MYYNSGMNIRASASFQPGNIAAILEQIIPRAITATENATALVAEDARSFAPNDTGELQSSIGTEVQFSGTTVEGSVFASAPYAAFVEYGTGLRGEAAPHGELPTEGVPFTGSWVYDFRKQDWKGMPARPFLRPALDINGSRIMAAFGEQGFAV